MGSESPLRVLYGEIGSRCGETVKDRPDWPCRRGCDACCRSLASIPSVTRPEWELLSQGLARLEEPLRDAVARRIRELTPARPVVCPFLDTAAGACLVYDFRPAACRTYGFYVSRGEGLYCREILGRFESGEYGDVVWGNADRVEEQRREFGEEREIRTWFVQGAEKAP